ncbi:hypothetical protein QAD02_010471 [Eretmocerus hayati]|uniref:Uncharacterized protein n=1 Tax=Eretmocerus hayati TaxID=131215 RepID=A0ACC2NYN1_9HYME|nr:hypothetical protein QAD02_010471 [Eretmocerus hayati]
MMQFHLDRFVKIQQDSSNPLAREPLVNIPAPAPLQLQPQPGPQANPAPPQPLPPAGPQQSPILIPQTSVQQVPAPQPYIDRYNQAALQQQQQQQQQQHQQIQQQQFQQQQLRQQQQQLRLQPVYKGIQQAVQRFGPQQQPLYTPQYKTSYPAQQQLQQPPPPPSNSLYRQPLPTPLQYRAQQLQQQQQQAQQSQQTLYPSNLPPHLQSVIQAQRSYQQQVPEKIDEWIDLGGGGVRDVLVLDVGGRILRAGKDNWVSSYTADDKFDSCGACGQQRRVVVGSDVTGWGSSMKENRTGRQSEAPLCHSQTSRMVDNFRQNSHRGVRRSFGRERKGCRSIMSTLQLGYSRNHDGPRVLFTKNLMVLEMMR